MNNNHFRFQTFSHRIQLWERIPWAFAPLLLYVRRDLNLVPRAMPVRGLGLALALGTGSGHWLWGNGMRFVISLAVVRSIT